MYSYKAECPHCGGNNLYVTPANGMSYCFNCQYTEFADGAPRPEKIRGPVKLIREYYKAMTDYYHSCMHTHARKYLHSRGITDDMIDQYKIGYCPNETSFMYNGAEAKESGMLNEAGYPALGGRVIFPYIHRSQVIDLRGRAIDPNDAVRYKSPHGARYYRGVDVPYNADDMYVSHILVEGEIKALILKKYGLNAVAVPGITLSFENYRPNTYYICFDSELDEKVRRDVKQAIFRAALWGADPYILTLPRDTEKLGADDYINKYGIDSFLMLYRAALPYVKWKRMTQ